MASKNTQSLTAARVPKSRSSASQAGGERSSVATASQTGTTTQGGVSARAAEKAPSKVGFDQEARPTQPRRRKPKELAQDHDILERIKWSERTFPELPLALRIRTAELDLEPLESSKAKWDKGGKLPCPSCNRKHPPPCLTQEQKEKMVVARFLLKGYKAQQKAQITSTPGVGRKTDGASAVQAAQNEGSGNDDVTKWARIINAVDIENVSGMRQVFRVHCKKRKDPPGGGGGRGKKSRT